MTGSSRPLGSVARTGAEEFIRNWRPTRPAQAKPFASVMYCAPDVYALEQERVFGGPLWVGVGGVHELTGAGSYLTAAVAGQPILVLRDGAGQLRAFFNVCPHRAGPLARGSGALHGAIQCQYHGWTFDLDGVLRKARDFEGVEDFEPTEFGLRSVRVESWLHSVFISLHPDAPPLLEYIEGLPERMGDRGVGRYLYAFTQEYVEQANWKLVWENASEGYHLPFVHPQLPFNPKLAEEEIGLNYSLQLSRSREGGGGGDADESYVVNLFPNTFFVVPTRARWDQDYFMAVYTMPQGADQTRFRLDFYVPPERLNDPSLDGLRKAWEEINEQDVQINQEVQRAMASMGYNQGRLSLRWEKALHHFQDLFMKYLIGER